MIIAANILPPAEEDLTQAGFSLPSSRELGSLFQEEFTGATGLAARWAAEKVQGNRGLRQEWLVPFEGEAGSKGCFVLSWDAELQRYLAGRMGAAAGRPEYMGALLRAAAGRWASWQALRSGSPVRLQASPDGEPAWMKESPWRSSAALIIDSFVIELAFVLEPREG